MNISKTLILNNTDQIVSSSNVWWEYLSFNKMSLTWNINDENEVHTDAGWGGDSSITERSFEMDGDMLISIGWGDGFAVRRLENGGTFSNIYWDNIPMETAYLSSMTIDRVNHIAYIGNYIYDGVMTYDYSDCYDGSDVVVKGTEINPVYDEGGYSYLNGYTIVGDFLYIVPDEASTSTCRRYDVVNNVQDDLTVTNLVSNGQQGEAMYDDVNNRVYLIHRLNGGIWVITNPENGSTASSPPECFAINLYTLGVSNDIHTPTLVVDNSNKNHLWVAAQFGGYFKIDITDILNGNSSSPTLLKKNPDWDLGVKQHFPFRLNGYISGRSHPIHGSDLILIRPDRDHSSHFGWLDKENMLPVTNGLYYAYDSSGSLRKRYDSTAPLIYSYASFPILGESSDSSQYWIAGGYSNTSGYKFKTYDVSTGGLELKKEGEIIFGSFTFDTISTIRKIKITNIKDHVFVLSGTSFYVYVSNDSGTTWELYNYITESYHIFSNIGNTLRIKFTFSGDGTKCSYVNALDGSNFNIEFNDESDIGYSKSNLKTIKGSS